jgi:hypothetical protein
LNQAWHAIARKERLDEEKHSSWETNTFGPGRLTNCIIDARKQAVTANANVKQEPEMTMPSTNGHGPVLAVLAVWNTQSTSGLQPLRK